MNESITPESIRQSYENYKAARKAGWKLMPITTYNNTPIVLLTEITMTREPQSIIVAPVPEEAARFKDYWPQASAEIVFPDDPLEQEELDRERDHVLLQADSEGGWFVLNKTTMPGYGRTSLLRHVWWGIRIIPASPEDRQSVFEELIGA